MNAEKVLRSMMMAARGRGVIYTCDGQPATADAFTNCIELMRVGVFSRDVEYNFSLFSLRFPGGGTIEFRDAHKVDTSGFQAKSIVHDEA